MTSITFKNKMGKFITKGLFFETSLDKDTVVYTLKDEDYNGYPSLYRLYMETGDPTEWAFATNCLGGWSHWEQLQAANWLKPYIKRWRTELELKIKSEQLLRVMQTAGNDSKESYQAQKFLLQGGWIEEKKHSRGRPSKDDIRKAAAEELTSQNRVDNDYNRIIGILN
jgi:hypothetical protein